MWSRVTLAVLLGLTGASCPAQEKDSPVVEIKGSNADAGLMKLAPANGVIATEKEWKKLAQAWGIKDEKKVDFTKQLLVVATSVGSQVSITPKVDEDGDLKVVGIATSDFGPGFRFVIKSVDRKGVKTVNGKPLPE